MGRSACKHCDNGTSHEQWAVLLCSPKTSSWDYSRQPSFALCCHNRNRHYIRGRKSTKQGAPHHVNALIVGPFNKRAQLYVQTMKANNRNFHNRIVRGIHLAQVWDKLDPYQTSQLQFYAYNNGYRVDALKMLTDSNDPANSVEHMMRLTASQIDADGIEGDAVYDAWRTNPMIRFLLSSGGLKRQHKSRSLPA